MKNLLFISPYPLPISQGSIQHAHYFLKALLLHFNVYCVFFVQPEEEYPQNHKIALSGLSIKEYKIIKIDHSIEVSSFKSKIRSLSDFPGTAVCRGTKPEILGAIKDIIRRYEIEIIHIEQFNFAKYAFYLKGHFKKAIVYHDLHHLIYLQQTRFQHSWRSMALSLLTGAKYFLFEKLLDRKVDLKVFLNADEMRSLPKNAIHIPHVVNPDIHYRRPKPTSSCNLLFIGGYAHPPNRISIDFIMKKIIPALCKRDADFRFHLVGSGMKMFKKEIGRSSIKGKVIIHGFVEDINQAFENIDIALFPIIYGGGTKTKTIDAMAAGVPVVTTPEGIFGLHNLPGNCIGVGDSALLLIEEIVKLINNYPLRLERSSNALKYVQSEYSFDIFSKRITETYLKL